MTNHEIWIQNNTTQSLWRSHDNICSCCYYLGPFVFTWLWLWWATRSSERYLISEQHSFTSQKSAWQCSRDEFDDRSIRFFHLSFTFACGKTHGLNSDPTGGRDCVYVTSIVWQDDATDRRISDDTSTSHFSFFAAAALQSSSNYEHWLFLLHRWLMSKLANCSAITHQFLFF